MNVASFIKVFAAVAWLAFFGLIGIIVLRASRSKNVKGNGDHPAGSPRCRPGLIHRQRWVGFHPAGRSWRGDLSPSIQVVTVLEPLQPGLRWIIPFFENVVILPHLTPDLHHVHRSQ